MLITVSLVTFNGMPWLPACLDALESQTHSELELIVFDNASSDGSREWLRRRLRGTGVRLFESDRNLGYARAHNRVLRVAGGELVCLLNQDVMLDPGALREAAAPFADSPTLAAVQMLVARLGPNLERRKVIDTTGLEIRRDRRVMSRDHGAPEPPDRPSGPVFGADGPCPLYRRTALIDCAIRGRGGQPEALDEDFFAYKEDVDLAWRLQLAGWTAAYVATARAWHGRSAADPHSASLADWIAHRRSLPAWLRRASWRNHRLMQIKNEVPVWFLSDLWPIARREIATTLLMLAVDPRDYITVVDMLRHIPRALDKRAQVQARRRLRQVDFERWLS